MGKVKKVKAEDVVSVPKQSSLVLSRYIPLPKMAGCRGCF